MVSGLLLSSEPLFCLISAIRSLACGPLMSVSSLSDCTCPSDCPFFWLHLSLSTFLLPFSLCGPGPSSEPAGGVAERHEGRCDPPASHAVPNTPHRSPPSDVRAQHPQPTGQQGHGASPHTGNPLFPSSFSCQCPLYIYTSTASESYTYKQPAPNSLHLESLCLVILELDFFPLQTVDYLTPVCSPNPGLSPGSLRHTSGVRGSLQRRTRRGPGRRRRQLQPDASRVLHHRLDGASDSLLLPHFDQTPSLLDFLVLLFSLPYKCPVF